MRVYENSEDKRILEDKRKIGGMKRNEADKKVESNLYLALGAEGKRVFFQKHPRVKVLSMFFWTSGSSICQTSNHYAERYKLLGRKQKNRKSYEQFWGALSDLASSC